MTDYTYNSEQEVIEAGDLFQRAKYWQRIKDMAEEAIAEHPHDEEARREYVEQDVDGTDYVIYTYKQLLVMRFTEHDDAYEEATGEGNNADQTVRVYYAMVADVMEEVERLLPEGDEEEEEDA